jgi:hypothetical protein
MPAKSASREFSSAQTTARPPGFVSMPPGGIPVIMNAGVASVVPR